MQERGSYLGHTHIRWLGAKISGPEPHRLGTLWIVVENHYTAWLRDNCCNTFGCLPLGWQSIPHLLHGASVYFGECLVECVWS